MMKTLLLALCLLATVLDLPAQESVRTYEKQFPVAGITELVLTNAYGDLEIIQTSDTGIQVRVQLSATSKSAAKADECLAKLQVREVRTGNSLHLETVYGKEVAFGGFVTGNNVHADYRVEVPRGVRLRLICAGGDISLGEFVGDLHADLSAGNFRAASLTGGDCYVKQSAGDFTAGHVACLSGEFNACHLTIESAGDLHVETASSDLNIASSDKLNIRSSGGSVKLGDVEQLIGSSTFTKYEIEDLGECLDMGMTMGTLDVRNVHPLFSEIRLRATFTKVGIAFASTAGYRLEITRNKALKFELPQGARLEEEGTAERGRLVGSCFVGNPQHNSRVILQLSGGDLFIQ